MSLIKIQAQDLLELKMPPIRPISQLVIMHLQGDLSSGKVTKVPLEALVDLEEQAINKEQVFNKE